MFAPSDNIEEEESKSVYKIIAELEEEKKRLHDEKANLLDIEAKLQARVNEELAIRKRENEELKNDVDTLKKRCEELTQVLNNRRLD